MLLYNEGKAGELIQYVRITRTTTEDRTFTYLTGGEYTDFQASVTQADLSDVLRYNFPGSPPSRTFGRDTAKTLMRDTTVADAASYYGASPTVLLGAIGDTVVKVASIYSQIVPNSRTETISLDQRPAAQRTLTLATSPREITVGSAPHTTRLKVGQENRGFSWVNILKPFPAPNTIVISYMALGVWYTVTDDGAGALTGAGAGTVNYANGTIALTVPALPDVGSAIIFNWGEKSAFTNRTGQAGFRAPEYALQLDHAGIKPDVQTGASPANAIRASRTNTLHRQAVCKTANPSDLHAAESCSSGDVHVRGSLSLHGARAGLHSPMTTRYPIDSDSASITPHDSCRKRPRHRPHPGCCHRPLARLSGRGQAPQLPRGGG